MKNLHFQISLGIVLTIFSVINAAIPQPEGALISATFTSTVGIMLDETPVEGGFRTRVAEYYLNQPIEFWEGKAFEQSRYTTFRQIFRSSYQEGKRQLTLPPYEVWKYTFDPAGPRRTQIEGHDFVAYDYTFYSVVVTSAASVVASEPDLEQIGGKWSDTWFLPADTDLLFQRTGYACVDEYAFPKDSADSENVWVYYDDQCVAEEPQVEYDAYEVRCHYTAYPNESCVEALTNHVGTSMVEITWERIPYTNEEAAKWRVGQLTSDGADMAVIGEHGFMAGSTQNRLEYKYIDKTSCTLSEGGKNDDGCVGGPGWRRLLKFSSSSINIGKTDIIIGDAPSSQLTNSTLYQLGVYEFDECHQHAHFQHYGDFYYGETPGRKVGFCLQTTWRYFNNEYTKLNSPFDTCQYQGISTGWGDDYIAGLDCQWIDVTDSPAGTDQLGEVFNPDGFLCEGTPILDPQTGGPLWLETEFRNDKGDVVHRAACDFTPNYMENNIDHVPVTLPTHGSRVTQSCKGGDLGHLRDCGFSIQKQTVECTPGSKVHLELSNESPETPQVVRICEASRVLGSIACVEQQALVNTVVMSGKTKVSFTCPVARDYAPETGGLYTILTAPFLESDPRQHVDVVVVGKHNNNDDSDCMPGDTILNFNFAGLISTKN